MIFASLAKFFKPHVYAPTINHINFAYLKSDLGINVLIFDKDDTLTLHHIEQIHEAIRPETIKAICELFGRSAFICSNSRRKWTIDYSHSQSLVNKHSTFESILTRFKKPFNFADFVGQVAEKIGRKPQASEICIIGDRILTDVLLAKLNGCLSIFVDGFEESKRSSDLEFLRRMENKLLTSRFQNKSVLISDFSGKIIDPKKIFIQP